MNPVTFKALRMRDAFFSKILLCMYAYFSPLTMSKTLPALKIDFAVKDEAAQLRK
jgi:hypothetical protein